MGIFDYVARSNLMNKWRMIPNPVPITLRRKQADGTFVNTSITHAWPRETKRDEAIELAAVGQETGWWWMPVELAGEIQPKIGDLVVDSRDSSIWSVQIGRSAMERTFHDVFVVKFKK